MLLQSPSGPLRSYILQTDNLGFGADLRKQGNKDVLEGKDSFRYGTES